MQLPGWPMLHPHSLHPGQSSSAPFPPPYPFQSTSPMPSYPTFYPPPLHALTQHHPMGYPPPPPLAYQQPQPQSSPMSALSASMNAVRPPSMPAAPAPQPQPQSAAPTFTSHPPTFSSSAPVFASGSTDSFMSSTAVPASVYHSHVAHNSGSSVQQQQPMASSPSSRQPASSVSSSTSTPSAAMSRAVVSRSAVSAPLPSTGSSERKKKRKRSGRGRASNSSGGRRSTGAGESDSSDEGDIEDKEKEEKTDSESDDISVAADPIQSLNDAGNAVGRGSAGGLGQYELELLQREVDELHDEAMAERTRADEVEDRHIRLLQKGRQLAAKCAQLDTVLQAALAVAVPEQENRVLLRWDIQLSVLYAEMKAILADLVDTSTNEQEAAVHSARSTAPASSVAHARLSRFLSKSAGERFCKPCRLITTLSKRPFRVLLVDVQRQYTMSKKETRRMTKEEKERLVSVPLRIMGTPNRSNLYFVAKDVCILIHTRKGNVAKSIGQFSEKQKARMPVLCVRSNGTVSTHILTVLTVEGVQRLLGASRSMLAPQVLTWILQQVDVICGDNPADPPPSSTATTASSSASSSSSSSPVTATTIASAP